MYKFVCEHIVPGCTHTDQDESREQLMERVAVHLDEHHDMDHRQDRIAEVLHTDAIFLVRPM